MLMNAMQIHDESNESLTNFNGNRAQWRDVVVSPSVECV
jgi:hypothetical protein